MTSIALRGSTQALNNLSHTKNAAYAPFYLAPVATRVLPNPVYQHGRRTVATTTQDVPANNRDSGPTHGKNDLPIEVELILSSRYKQDGATWARIINTYLPLKLRLGEQILLDEPTRSVITHQISTLPRVLSRARDRSKIDLLSHLGVYQGRWEAVIWLVKAMMEHYKDPGDLDEQSKRSLSPMWPRDDQSLDVVTNEPIRREISQLSELSLRYVIHRDEGNSAKSVALLARRSLGQIWQSLGTMILQAADRSPEDPSYIAIMTQVFRILAHLHRIDAFPKSIYNYAPATDPTVLQRPPTLHLLSRRIMSTLSDVEFCLHWNEEILKYQKLGYDLPKTSAPPKIREFGPELWLDLILWACVEGGWVTEGIWIVGEMERRKGSRDTQWSVIGWQEICARKAPKRDWASILIRQIDKTRLNQVGGLGIATGTDSTVDMGTRTISREVVLALMDGLINTAHSRVNEYGESSSEVQQSVITCRNLLKRNHPDLDARFLNTIILRVMESTGVDARDAPGVLQRFIDLRDTTAPESTSADANPPGQNANTDDTGPILGLLHSNLYRFAQEGNLQGSLTTFRKFQNVIDSERKKLIEDFADELRTQVVESDECDDLSENIETTGTAPVSAQIPASVLVAFLDLITDSKLYDLGHWLIQNEDIDGGVIDQELLSNHNLQPSLLRFATATANNTLLTKILEQIEPPLSEPILHALLRCQIVLGKWSAVKELLEYLQKMPGMAWKASDATAIASAIMQMEHGPTDAETVQHLSQARDVLFSLIQGGYNSDRDLSQLPDLSEAKLANQLRRIFKTLRGSLGSMSIETTRDINRAHASISVTPNAFNILLETTVECYGVSAGWQLWKRWCREPGETPQKSGPTIQFSDGHSLDPATEPTDQSERVVTPTRYMLRNILRPILRIRQRPLPVKDGKADERVSNPTSESQSKKGGAESIDSNSVQDPIKEGCRRPLKEQEQEILEWGLDMYRKFGLSEKMVNREIPGAFPYLRPERAQSSLGDRS